MSVQVFLAVELFNNLILKFLQVDISISIEDGETAEIRFTGVGYDKRMLADTFPISDSIDNSGVPSIQNAPLPGQVKCFLFFYHMLTLLTLSLLSCFYP